MENITKFEGKPVLLILLLLHESFVIDKHFETPLVKRYLSKSERLLTPNVEIVFERFEVK